MTGDNVAENEPFQSATLGEFLQCATVSYLLGVPNFGRKSVTGVTEVLQSVGLKLRER